MDAVEHKRVCVGFIASAHGVRGEVNISPYVKDAGFFSSHAEYANKNGDKTFTLRIKGVKQRFLIAQIQGIKDRNAAEALKGQELYVPREVFPEAAPEEFYYDDLVGLRVCNLGGQEHGNVVAVYNFGAGDVIEIALAATGKLVMYPFTKEVVPEVQLQAGYITVVPPETVSAKEEGPRGAE